MGELSWRPFEDADIPALTELFDLLVHLARNRFVGREASGLRGVRQAFAFDGRSSPTSSRARNATWARSTMPMP